MTPIIFLDLDGPMIPWWGKAVPDDTGANGRILSGFPFLSKFHDDAMNNLSDIIHATGALVVTNSTHNGGHSVHDGPAHIMRLFKANGIHHVLHDDTSKDWPKYMSGFKNRELKDWKFRKDRALGIRAWFVRFGVSMASTPFVAIDDCVEDFVIYNRPELARPKIPFVATGTDDADIVQVISKANATDAINIIRSHPNYVGKK